MAMSLNKVQLIGRIGKSEVRTTQTGKAITTLSVATGDKRKDQSGEWKEETQWHRVILWDKTAQFVNNYAPKGSRIYVEGVLKYREYTDKDGQKRQITEITGRDVIILEKKEPSRVIADEPSLPADATAGVPEDDGVLVPF